MFSPKLFTAGVLGVGLLAVATAPSEASKKDQSSQATNQWMKTPYGYWEGEGSASDTLIKDNVRDLTRKADFSFWFNLDEDGEILGEVEMRYKTDLVVSGLPKISAPAPGGTIKFNPTVGGQLTDPNPTRRFPLVGTFTDKGLNLEFGTPEAEREALEFTIRADAGISGAMKLGGIGMGSNQANAQLTVLTVDMVPFSPFGTVGVVARRPNGPHAARMETKGDSYAIEWKAKQVAGLEAK